MLIIALAARAQRPESEASLPFIPGSSDYVEMWDYYRNAADHYASIGDTARLCWATRSMGTAYEQFGMFGKAKELYNKALLLAQKSGDNIEIGINLHKIANSTSLQFFKTSAPSTIDTFYVVKKMLTKAGIILRNAPDAADIYAQNTIGMARCYFKLAQLLHRDDLADSCTQCLDQYLHEHPDDKDTIRPLQMAMLKIQSDVYLRRYSTALPALQQLLTNFSANRQALQMSEAYRLMSICYQSLGDYKRAFECSEQHMNLITKSYDDETMKRISNFAAQTELYNAMQEHDEYNRLMETEQSRQRFFYALMSLAIAAVIAAAALISVMLYSRQRTNRLLKLGNETRATLSEKHRKQLEAVADAQSIIIDSVEYASKIQTESIGNSGKLKEMFPESFVYYRPRDIVSGDWYYSSMVNGHRMVVAADCTGHGIPGAMLSMLGVGALKDVINMMENDGSTVTPGDILDRMRTSVKKALNKNKSTTEAAVDDGMEMSIIILPPEGSTLYFGGQSERACGSQWGSNKAEGQRQFHRQQSARNGAFRKHLHTNCARRFGVSVFGRSAGPIWRR